MNQSLVSGITGAAPIWHKIMSKILENRKPVWSEKPDGIVGKDVCVLTGLLAPNQSPNTNNQTPSCDTRHEFFGKNICLKIILPETAISGSGKIPAPFRSFYPPRSTRRIRVAKPYCHFRSFSPRLLFRLRLPHDSGA